MLDPMLNEFREEAATAKRVLERARAPKALHLLELRPRGHHDWPVKPTIREISVRQFPKG
jgi:hypothetical protein